MLKTRKHYKFQLRTNNCIQKSGQLKQIKFYSRRKIITV